MAFSARNQGVSLGVMGRRLPPAFLEHPETFKAPPGLGPRPSISAPFGGGPHPPGPPTSLESSPGRGWGAGSAASDSIPTGPWACGLLRVPALSASDSLDTKFSGSLSPDLGLWGADCEAGDGGYLPPPANQ